MMNSRLPLVVFFAFMAVNLSGQQLKSKNKNKIAAVATVDAIEEDLTLISDRIWEFAETALKEEKSAKLLADFAKQHGFRVTTGVANMPTAFIAEYGDGQPIIGVLGEYDALPGISQKAEPEKNPLLDGAAGHGCGHNLFGPGSLGAAIAIKELIEKGKLKGTVRFYGTPAEEAVGGKLYMAQAGLFDDLSVCLDWHPDMSIQANTQSSQAMVDFNVEFHGKTAHAASDPWNGRSALDGLELFTDGINMLREHIKPSVRIHYVIQNGGDVPNVVPEYARLWCWIRDSKREGVEEVFSRVKDIAKGAGLMAGVNAEITNEAISYELLVNTKGASVLYNNLMELGDIEYTEEENAFARKLQENAGAKQLGLSGRAKPLTKTKPDPDNGSTDVGDVSWIVPEITLLATTAPIAIPWHSWAVVASGGMSIGHKGMIYSAKALAMTMVDLFENESLRQAIRDEFEMRKDGHIYKTILPPGNPKIPSGK